MLLSFPTGNSDGGIERVSKIWFVFEIDEKKSSIFTVNGRSGYELGSTPSLLSELDREA